MPSAESPVHLVYTRQLWSQQWTLRPVLRATEINDACGPSHSTATLSARYGVGMLPEIGDRPRDTEPTTIPKANLRGHYCQIRVGNNALIWTGILLDSSDRQTGDWQQSVPTGVETYTAFGLSILLDQTEPIRRTYYSVNDSIGIAVPFNGGSDGRASRSRISTANFNATQNCFTDKTIGTPTFWKAKDAFKYLIERFAPRDKTGTKRLPLYVSQESYACLDYQLPPTSIEGLTLWQALNRLVDRSRGLMLFTRITAGGQLELVIDSSLRQQIQTPDGTIPANRNQASYSLSNLVNIESIEVATASACDQVIAYGERAGVVLTLSPEETTGQLIPDWDPDDEDTYNTAASDDSLYGDLTDPEKAAANADFRARDDLAAVFSWWRLDPAWNLECHNEGGGGYPGVFFIDLETGEPDTTQTGESWIDGLRFADFVPLRTGIDYSGDVTPETDDADTLTADYLPPIVVYKLPAIGSTADDDGWVYCERINAAVDSGVTEREFQWSIQVQVRDDLPGLVLQVVGGQQHFAAQDHYSPNASFEDIPSNEGVDLRSFLATVYVPMQDRVFAKYPADGQVTAVGDAKRVLTVTIPDCWLDWLAIGTVVGIESGALVQSTGGWLRDDRKRLQSVAELLYQWHAQPRARLSMTAKAIVTDFGIGQMVTTLVRASETQTLDTCVTSITLDLAGTGRTTIRTSFMELDLIGLLI